MNFYDYIEECREPNLLLKEIVILDYMITLKQLLELSKEGNLEQFYMKSKIQAIVEADVIDEVSGEHVRMIKNKLKALRII